MTEDSDAHPGRLRLVVENDMRSIRARQARDGLDGPLRQMAANILRIVRGAGKPYNLRRQCIAVVAALDQYADAGGLIGEDEIRARLSIAEGERRASEEADFEEGAIRGALQIAASRLLGQLSQVRNGEREFADGWIALAEAREARRRRYAAEAKAARTALEAKPAKRKVVKARSKRTVTVPIL